MTTPDAGSRIKSEYFLDNAWFQARERLAALEGRHDPGTIRQLEALGGIDGWQCLEIGGGGGSITEWLCQRVGPTGHVVATDINTRFLEALDFGNLEVRAHNIAEDELEQEMFDLVHSRAVLMHLPKRAVALKRMVSALKPGGVLVVEEGDFVSCVVDPRVGENTRNLWEKVERVRASLGEMDPYYGRRLYADVCALGMIDVRAEGRVSTCRGATPYAEFYRLTYSQLRDRFLEIGQFSPEEMDQLIALFNDPNFIWMDSVAMTVSARRPTTK
jgi:SAM-dependent methyltransferase